MWLSCSLAGHACILHEYFVKGTLPYGADLSKSLNCVTGHSAGFLSAALFGMGIDSEDDLLNKMKMGITFWTTVGARLNKDYVSVASGFVPWNIIVVGTPIATIEAATKSNRDVDVACINAPDQCIVSARRMRSTSSRWNGRGR